MEKGEGRYPKMCPEEGFLGVSQFIVLSVNEVEGNSSEH